MATATQKLESWNLAQVHPYEKNAKKHPQKQIEQLAKVIAAHGFDVPIVVDGQGVIIKGHGRLLAAQHLGLQRVPVLVRRDLTPAQVREARIADNRVAEMSTWDEKLLIEDVTSSIELEGFNLELLGLDASFVQNHIRLRGELEDTPVPERPKKPTTKPGTVWLLGEHRLVCGDSTSPENAALAQGGLKPFIMVTDPPYGVEYDPEHRASSDGRKVHSVGKVLNDDRADWEAAYKLFPGNVAYVWHASLFGPTVHANLATCGFTPRSMIVWVKQQFVFGRGAYHWQHEPCWYAVRDGAQAAWAADRKQSTVWQIENKLASKDEDANTTHGTQKPLECMARPMRNHGKAGDVVYDPFLGSGTSIIAAEQLERVCVGSELDPGYCDVIVGRWENLTGKKARREK